MQVQNINNYPYNYAYKTKPAFRGATSYKLPDLTNGLKEIRHIYAGTFGTYIEGSNPLQDFACAFKPEQMKAVFSRGLSTNIEGVANTILKTKWENPISTSGVFDCSVLYLANENRQTHFLYHMFKDSYYDKTLDFIKEFMPEGFTYAAIVPGDKTKIETHKKYLYEVFRAVKDSNPNAKIEAYHFSSKMPEIVGYKGKVYEIPRNNLEFDGQNSFRIENIHYYSNDLYKANLYNSTRNLKELSEIIDTENMDEEVTKAVQTYIKTKIDSLPERSKSDELFAILKDELRLSKENIKLLSKCFL